MKSAKAFFLIPAVILFSVCLTFSAASASSPYYTVLPISKLEHGILTQEDGQDWYRVRTFEDNTDYIITVKNKAGTEQILAATNDEKTPFIWSYYRYSMTTSTAPLVTTLYSACASLACRDNTLLTYCPNSSTSDMYWTHEGSALCWHDSSGTKYLKYDENSTEPFTMTADLAEAADVTLYAKGNLLERCIISQPAAESYVLEGSGYPAPVFSVGLADVAPDSIRWFVDGKEQDCSGTTLTADSLTGQPAGIHSVSCQVKAHDSEDVYYSEQSAEAAFVIAKGVIPDSVLTFSDVHEQYEFITDAIRQVMRKTDGYLPSLVICSGDFVNGPTAAKDRELNRYFPQIVPHLGGLDAVYVAGNHDSAEAASVMSANANLGADKNLPAAGGVIFRGESAAAKNARNSSSAKSIIAYGINFSAAAIETPAGTRYSYEKVIPDVERFLKETAAQYHGELIIISAHSGLHVVGLQTDSADLSYNPYYGWQGENLYNIDMSYELAQTINRYAEQYHMDIMYIYGHDHSRGEPEMFLTDGGELICPRHYADRSTENLTLHFTYAHAGYLNTTIGSAYKKFSFIVRDGDKFTYDLISADGVQIRHEEVPVKQPYEAPAETTAAPAPAETTAAQTQKAASGTKAAAPETGGGIPFLLPALPAIAALVLCRKRQSG